MKTKMGKMSAVTNICKKTKYLLVYRWNKVNFKVNLVIKTRSIEVYYTVLINIKIYKLVFGNW